MTQNQLLTNIVGKGEDAGNEDFLTFTLQTYHKQITSLELN